MRAEVVGATWTVSSGTQKVQGEVVIYDAMCDRAAIQGQGMLGYLLHHLRDIDPV